MDVDCDGLIDKNDDGRCDNAHSTQSTTAMKRYVAAYSNGVPDLNPFVHVRMLEVLPPFGCLGSWVLGIWSLELEKASIVL